MARIKGRNDGPGGRNEHYDVGGRSVVLPAQRCRLGHQGQRQQEVDEAVEHLATTADEYAIRTFREGVEPA